MGEAHAAAEQAARDSYGRLLALLASRSGDIPAAEEALADAFVAALTHWPTRGVPDNPQAWLLTAARNALHNTRRHAAVRAAAAVDIAGRLEERAEAGDGFPDERLKLLFACAHPAVDPAARAPLMLQTVLGLDAERIGRAFLVAGPAMGQRLVRAKTRIRDAGIRFAIPEPSDLPGRLADVLDAVYGAYGCGWDALGEPSGEARDLAPEAIFLGRLIVTLLPEEPEARGLLALMLYCEARRDARRDEAGRFVPLSQQDARLWKAPMIVEAEQHLHAASSARRFGRFQCEAAIQSVHVQRPITGRINHEALGALYGLLVDLAPSTGAVVGQAAVMIETGRADAALMALASVPEAVAARYQAFWAVKAKAFDALGKGEEAADARQRAIALTHDAAVAAHLSGRGA